MSQILPPLPPPDPNAGHPLLARKTARVVGPHTSTTRRTTMSETTPPTTPATSEVETETSKPNRFKSFVAAHPRITHAAKLTAAGAGLVFVTATAKNMQQNKAKLAEAADHAKASLEAVHDSTVTPDPEA